MLLLIEETCSDNRLSRALQQYITATKGGVITAPGIPEAIIAKLVAASGQDLRYKAQKPIISCVVAARARFGVGG